MSRLLRGPQVAESPIDLQEIIRRADCWGDNFVPLLLVRHQLARSGMTTRQAQDRLILDEQKRGHVSLFGYLPDAIPDRVEKAAAIVNHGQTYGFIGIRLEG